MSAWSSNRGRNAAISGLTAVLFIGGCNYEMPPPYTGEPHFHLYALNEKVRFGLGGDSHRFKLHGWSHTEQEFTWTDGAGASLIFFAPRTDRDVTFEMRLSPCLHPPELLVQPVHVTLNGRRVATWEVTEEKVYTLTIPHDFIAARPRAVPGRPNLRDSVVLLFDFFIPKAQFPALIATGPDWRRLGVRCSDLTMREGAKYVEPNRILKKPREGEVAPYSLGSLVLFGGRQNGELYKVSGWNGAEPGFTWTGKDPAVLKFKLEPINRPLALKLVTNGNTHPPSLLVQPTQVYANGRQIAEWQVDVRADYIAEIPTGVVGPDGILVLEFVSKNATSPRKLGVNTDSRLLGIACYELVLTDAEE